MPRMGFSDELPRLRRGGIGASNGLPTSYTTGFSATENPVSEGGMWKVGGNFGTWHSPQTANGHCFAVGANDSDADDSVCFLDPTKHQIAVNQRVTSIIHRPAGAGYAPGVSHETQIFLRVAGGTNSIRGYECIFPYFGSDQCQVVRWNGALNDFTVLSGTGGGGGAIGHGDTIEAQISGSTIILRHNGSQVYTVTDTTYVDGSPGLAFFFRTGATPESYCVDTFTAIGI
jgi:hypothetical protein